MSNVLKDSLDIQARKQQFQPELKQDISQRINPKATLFSTFNSVYRYYNRNKKFLFEIVISMRKPLPNET